MINKKKTNTAPRAQAFTKSICVYCASSDAISPDFFTVATELGVAIAREGYALIYGGGEIGLMGAIARSMHQHGGHVVGVIPEFLRKPGICYENCDELIVTSDMRERKGVMESRADGFIALPGGFGTLEEMLEIITLKQLRVLNKPVVFLNTSGFYDGLNTMFEHIFEHQFAKSHNRELYHFASHVADAMSHIESYEPLALGSKWY
ncbi:MAG: LOG family protein [Armatimonadota bacterium]